VSSLGLAAPFSTYYTAGPRVGTARIYLVVRRARSCSQSLGGRVLISLLPSDKTTESYHELLEVESSSALPI
jgi:hypothetical protein